MGENGRKRRGGRPEWYVPWQYRKKRRPCLPPAAPTATPAAASPWWPDMAVAAGQEFQGHQGREHARERIDAGPGEGAFPARSGHVAGNAGKGGGMCRRDVSLRRPRAAVPAPGNVRLDGPSHYSARHPARRVKPSALQRDAAPQAMPTIEAVFDRHNGIFMVLRRCRDIFFIIFKIT